MERVVLTLAKIKTEDTFRWPSKVLLALPRHQRRKPTLHALLARGLVEHKHKRMGAGITCFYYRLTKQGRHVAGSLSPSSST
jgi:hypothetical protein